MQRKSDYSTSDNDRSRTLHDQQHQSSYNIRQEDSAVLAQNQLLLDKVNDLFEKLHSQMEENIRLKQHNSYLKAELQRLVSQPKSSNNLEGSGRVFRNSESEPHATTLRRESFQRNDNQESQSGESVFLQKDKTLFNLFINRISQLEIENKTLKNKLEAKNSRTTVSSCKGSVVEEINESNYPTSREEAHIIQSLNLKCFESASPVVRVRSPRHMCATPEQWTAGSSRVQSPQPDSEELSYLKKIKIGVNNTQVTMRKQHTRNTIDELWHSPKKNKLDELFSKLK